MPRIKNIHAREVLDSRGDPTVEVDVVCDSGALGRAIVPAGASTGAAEACELRDGDTARYRGRGVRRPVANVNERLASALVGFDPADQLVLDARLIELDGTPNKSELGANAILGVSLAAAHAAAAAREMPLYRHIHQLWHDELERALPTPLPSREGPGEGRRSAAVSASPSLNLSLKGEGFDAPRLPMPMTNMISGGLHAGGNLDFQDFLIVPVGAPDYSTALEWLVRVANRLGALLSGAGYEGRLVGDEGGYGPRLKDNRHALDFLARAIEDAALVPGNDVTIALDVASTHFFDGSTYRLTATGGERLSADQMIDLMADLVEAYPISSIEDPLAEDDWSGWQAITRRLGSRVRLVGDDLFATNADRLRRGIEQGAANAVLIKVNQIGTLSETLRTMHLARSTGYACVVSARSGETEDTTMADLAVGTAAEMIKIGCIKRSERLAKYNRLLRIEEELGAAAGWRAARDVIL